MIKAILMLIVILYSIKIMYTAAFGKANGPYSKEVELLWRGEECGSFGKVIVIGVPIVLLFALNAIF